MPFKSRTSGKTCCSNGCKSGRTLSEVISVKTGETKESVRTENNPLKLFVNGKIDNGQTIYSAHLNMFFKLPPKIRMEINSFGMY